MNFGPQTV